MFITWKLSAKILAMSQLMQLRDIPQVKNNNNKKLLKFAF